MNHIIGIGLLVLRTIVAVGRYVWRRYTRNQSPAPEKKGKTITLGPASGPHLRR